MPTSATQVPDIGSQRNTGVVATRMTSARVVGRGTVSPRGVEVGHDDVELRREHWRPPFAVEIDGLGTCLPLFGVSRA